MNHHKANCKQDMMIIEQVDHDRFSPCSVMLSLYHPLEDCTILFHCRTRRKCDQVRINPPSPQLHEDACHKTPYVPPL